MAPAPLKRPMDPAASGNESAALGALVNFLNREEITGAKVEGPVKSTKPATRAPAVPVSGETQAIPAGSEVINLPPKHESVPVEATVSSPVVSSPEPAQTQPSPASINGAKIFYTGRLKAGKDFCAVQSGAKIFGFSEPLYFLLNYFFGLTEKDKYGARKFLQQAGQWGRGVLNDDYPVSPERAAFVNMVREHAAGGFGGRLDEIKHLCVQWENFGHDSNIWLDAIAARMGHYLEDHPESRVATTNVRFEHEYKRMRELGFRHYHVMCSTRTWQARLQKDGLSINSPVLKDYSEQLAMAFDADTTKKISQARVGKKLNVIWNDDGPPPSPRFYTVPEFLALIGAPAKFEVPIV